MDRERKNPIEEAKKIGVPYVETQRVVEYLVPDMIMSCYRQNPKTDTDRKINEKVKKAFKDLHPNSSFEDITKSVRSTFLVGPPGHGKTTAFREAAKKAAKALGMDYVEDLREDTKIDENTYLFISEEFSGETSKMGVGGIPGKRHEVSDDGTEVEYMIHLMPRRIAMLQKAGGGVFLLDDFTNASKAVQNIGLSLSLEKRYQSTDIGNSYVALTGNLGAIDGTNTSTASTALLNRLRMYFVQDNPENFIERGERKYKGSFGDLGILGFLERNEQYFTQFPDSRQSGPFATPRSWDAFIESAIGCAALHGSPDAALSDIQMDARALLGEDVGAEFAAYFYSLLEQADPLARQCIMEGDLNEDEVRKRYSDGFSAKEHDFAYQYAVALADYAVRRISKDPDNLLEETMERYALGTLAFAPEFMGTSIDYFKRKLANQVESLSETSANNKREIQFSVKERIAKVFDRSEECTGEHMRILIEAITDYDKIEASASNRTRNRKKREV